MSTLLYTLDENTGRLVVHDDVKYLSKDLFNKSLRRSVKELILGRGVKEIWLGAFRGWPLLQKVHCNDALKSIGVFAFKACPLLTEVEFGAGLEHIGGRTFEGCTALKNSIATILWSILTSNLSKTVAAWRKFGLG